MSTVPRAPKDLITKRTGPSAPPPRASDSSNIIADPIVQNNFSNSSVSLKVEVQSKLEEEATDLIRTHAQVVNLLDSSSDFGILGKVLTDALNKLSPGGTAIFAPIVHDFRDQVLADLRQEEDFPTSVQEGSIDQLYSLLNSISVDEAVHLVNGIQTSLLIETQKSQTQESNEQKVRHDAINGYKSVISSAVNCAELISSYGPRVWRDLSASPEISTSDLSIILYNASRSVYDAYASSSENAMSIHSIVRSSSDKSRKIAGNLKSTAAYLSAASTGFQYIKNPQKYDPSNIVSKMKQAALSAVKKEVTNVLTELGKSLKNSAPHMSSKQK